MFGKRVILRIIVIIVFSLFLNFTPKEDLIKAGLIKKVNIENKIDVNDQK